MARFLTAMNLKTDTDEDILICVLTERACDFEAMSPYRERLDQIAEKIYRRRQKRRRNARTRGKITSETR